MHSSLSDRQGLLEKLACMSQDAGLQADLKTTMIHQAHDYLLVLFFWHPVVPTLTSHHASLSDLTLLNVRP